LIYTYTVRQPGEAGHIEDWTQRAMQDASILPMRESKPSSICWQPPGSPRSWHLGTKTSNCRDHGAWAWCAELHQPMAMRAVLSNAVPALLACSQPPLPRSRVGSSLWGRPVKEKGRGVPGSPPTHHHHGGNGARAIAPTPEQRRQGRHPRGGGWVGERAGGYSVGALEFSQSTSLVYERPQSLTQSKD
jgi:hypothetical protein